MVHGEIKNLLCLLPTFTQQDNSMTLAIFDLDNTLIAGDSDHLWGEFLVEQGLVDGEAFKATNDGFYNDYLNGQLDIYAYQRFVLGVLAQHSLVELAGWHQQFMDEVIRPIMLPKAHELIAKHREQGHYIMIITATNDFITAPIAEAYGVDHLIAVTAERDETGGYTGEVEGTPSFQDGKITRLNEWLADNPSFTMKGSYFYSDSFNDLPLLRIVDHPIAVNPDETLAAEAKEKGWEILDLRQ